MLPRCIENGTRVHRGCSHQPSPIHQKTIGDASQVHRGWYPRPFAMLRRSITDAPKEHKEWYPGASEMLPKTIADASGYRYRGFRVVQLVEEHQERDESPAWPRLWRCTPRSAQSNAGARGGSGAREPSAGPNEGRASHRHSAANGHGPTPHPACWSVEVRTPPAVANFLSAPRAAPVKARVATGAARLALRGASTVLWFFTEGATVLPHPRVPLLLQWRGCERSGRKTSVAQA